MGFMDGFWVLLVVLGAVGLMLFGLARLAARARRRGISGSMLGPFEEMWRVTAYESRIEMQIQSERKAPLPSPDDL
jgi:Sec-independent protein translocase protein TatA